MNQERMNRLVNTMNSENVEAVLIIPSESLGFYTGHVPLLCERFQGLFVKENGDFFYFCNLLTRSEAGEMLGLDRTYTWHDNDVMTNNLRNVLEKYDLLGKRIAVDSKARAFNILTIQENIDVSFYSGKELLESVALFKTEEEMELLRKAAELTDRVIGEVISSIRPGMTEKEIIGKVEKGFEDEGAEPDFAIVACGKNTALPHYTGTSGVVQKNDVVLLDIGCKLDGISSDMTRTVFVGNPTERMKQVYALVLKANQKGEETARLGVSVDAVDSTARNAIEEAGYGEYFTTRIGHGIGYSTHEAPYIKQNSGQILEKGMAFSIEPGIYIEGEFGVRIEDIVIMTDQGPEVINHYNKNMIVL